MKVFSFNNLPIKSKLWSIFIVILISVIGMCAAFIYYQSTLIKKNNIQKLELTAQLIGNSNLEYLRFEDKATAIQMLKGLQLPKAIHSICIYDEYNELFISYFRTTPSSVGCPLHESKIKSEINNIKSKQAVMYRGYRVGTTYVFADQSEILSSQRSYVYLSLIFSAAFLLIVISLYYIAQRYIVIPILSLSSTVRRVKESCDYSLRAPRFSQDEIGQLAESVNDMLRTTQEHSQKLQESNIKIKNASDAKSNFLANMSHELRTPLVTINGYSELISHKIYGGEIDKQYQEAAKFILTAGKHLLGLINDILDLSKIEAGKVTLEEEEVDIPAILKECYRFIERMATKKHITLNTNLKTESLHITGDKVKIKQVFLNILHNAVKFTPDNGNIEIYNYFRKEGIYIVIRDTGIGIAQQDIEKALSDFQQISSPLGGKLTKEQGTGLGLPIAKKLIELHGGNLTLDSQLTKGTTVTIFLPSNRVHYVLKAA